MKKSCILFILFFSYIISYGQNITQTIRGEVVDKNTGTTLIGATVVLLNSDPLIGVVTDENGLFKLENVPVGRQGIQVSYIGYKSVTLQALYLESGKELVLRVELVENVISVDEVIIKANGKKDRPLNDMAKISARSFTIEETEKYAGSWGDPSRMALNFAGVMSSSDQQNSIIIRGNSPNGLLFRLEGIDIPNPNHFGTLGSTGGPISMLNNNVLSNSDFFTSAFPAQYGNALSGIFDLGLRSGNNEKYELMGQVGFNGFELGAEGPVKKNSNASFIANYRYSTMGVMDALGIDIGVGAIPYYQDLSFKIDVPGTKFGRFSVFGVGGKNHITFETDEENKKGYTNYASKMGVIGVTHLYYFNDNTRLKTTLAGTYHGENTQDTLQRELILDNWYGDEFKEWKFEVSTELKKKFNSKNTLLIGGNFKNIHMNYLDSFWIARYARFYHNFDLEGQINMVQAYTQWQHKLNNQFTVVSGIHFQTADLNNEIAVEPRIGAEYEFLPNKTISMGYGMHSRLQPTAIYFTEYLTDTLNGVYSEVNKELKFSKSHQFVIGYNQKFTTNTRLKVEAYYQSLYDIPVTQYSSLTSMINYEGGYYDITYDSLVNKGIGTNYGVELTFEKFFSDNYYYLLTVSLFDSKYKASDGIERNTAFNGNYVVNLLGGYEFTLGRKNTLAFDFKGVWAGGMRSIPIDLDASTKDQTVYKFDEAFEKRHDDYYKIDLRISFKLNSKKFSQEWALDISNLTNHQNRFFEYYDPDKDEIVQAGYMGIVPIMLWRIHF